MSRAAWLAGLLVAAGCASPVVGGECVEGRSVCEGRCVNLDFDRNNCGACGNVCSGSTVCADGACVDETDGAVPDAGAPDADAGFPDDGGSGDGGGTLDGGGDGATADGGTDDGGTDDGGTDDGGTDDGGTDDGGPGPSCDVGQLECGGVCIDPETDPLHCGECDDACASDEFCAAGSCEPACDAPLEKCGGVCVDVMTHADHCGECGVSCASGICVGGLCSLGETGHIVVIGHDYRSSRSGMGRLAYNAVFLATGAPVRVLVYEGDSAQPSIQGVDQAIDEVAGSTGRSWERTETSADRVPFGLAQADVFLVYSQHGATDDELRSLGVEWATALEGFVRRGGVIVLFDGGGAHDGTWKILDAAGLFRASGRTDIDDDRVDVISPGDAVAVNVPRRYRAEPSSVAIDTEEPGTVVWHPDGSVVIHRVVFPSSFDLPPLF